jgi:hypothetical protein
MAGESLSLSLLAVSKDSVGKMGMRQSQIPWETNWG